ncbi:MAG: septum formation initiator family protein [Candidatus Cohnella colombiensis]|uniref:Septum formation initiator family protein n=1 Tax=Candidatus Cohnella colombiensis TaxID=3121368 RepID=A0AA95EZU0_9BACL|nr:MAG: septum formation initiator family protein [Cohnella sp.]
MSSRTIATTPASTGVRRRLKLLIFLMILFMSWAVYVLFTQYGQINDRTTQLREADKQLSDAVIRSEQLKQEIVKLNDQEYVSELARKDQGLGYPGEVPINIDGE